MTSTILFKVSASNSSMTFTMLFNANASAATATIAVVEESSANMPYSRYMFASQFMTLKTSLCERRLVSHALH